MENQTEQYQIDEVFEERVKQAVALSEREHLMMFLTAVEDEYQQSHKKTITRTIPQRRWMGVAATLLLAAAAFFVFRSLNTVSPADLVALHYEPYPNVSNPITRSGEPQEVNDELRGLLAYEGGRYDVALKYFDQIEVNDHIRLYKAISWFESGNSQAAEAELITLIDTNSEHLRPAQWYMGLMLLKDGFIDRAKEYFKILADQPSDSSYQKDASDILKLLN